MQDSLSKTILPPYKTVILFVQMYEMEAEVLEVADAAVRGVFERKMHHRVYGRF